MQCPNCLSPLVATGDGGTFVCRSCSSQNNNNGSNNGNGNGGLALVGNNNAVAAAAAAANLSNLPDPRSALTVAAEHIEFYLQAKEEAARGENEALAARAKEAVDGYRAKLEKIYAAYTKARSRLVEALRASAAAEADSRELQQKYAMKAK